MKVETTLDSSSFNAAMRKLAKLTGKSFSKVIKSEAGAILSKALKSTGSASASSITRHYTYKDPGDNVNTVGFVRISGRKLRVRTVKKKGVWVNGANGTRYFDKEKTNPDWKPLQAELKRLKKRAKDRRGLSKATWVRVASMAKLQALKGVPGYVMKAYGLMGGSIKRAVKGKEVGDQKFYILVQNKSYTAMAPKAKKGPGGWSAFRVAMMGRKYFYERNLKEGVFLYTKAIAEKYPGLDVTM